MWSFSLSATWIMLDNPSVPFLGSCTYTSPLKLYHSLKIPYSTPILQSLYQGKNFSKFHTHTQSRLLMRNLLNLSLWPKSLSKSYILFPSILLNRRYSPLTRLLIAFITSFSDTLIYQLMVFLSFIVSIFLCVSFFSFVYKNV